MNRSQFAHTVRAAAAILGVNEVLVIGSQAVLKEVYCQQSQTNYSSGTFKQLTL